MPVNESQDYILLINEDIENKNNEMMEANRSSTKKEEPATFSSVFRGASV